MNKIKRLFTLFWTFFKIGLFTFGGGYAMLAVVEDICVEKKKWITHDDMMNVTVIGEATPGPIAINCATFVGYREAGILGAIFTTLGVCLPSFVIIYVISLFLDGFLGISWVANAFKGVAIAVAFVIVNTALRLFKKIEKTPLNIVIFTLSVAAVLCIDFLAVSFSTIYLILIAGLVGAAVYFIQHHRARGQTGEVDEK